MPSSATARTIDQPSGFATGRGGRPVGARYRDYICATVPFCAGPKNAWTLRHISDALEATPAELAPISRALRRLAAEGRIHRALVKVGPGRPRWVHWK